MGASCSDYAMAAFIMIFKNIMTVFQIIVPILLIVSASMSLGKMVLSPDEDPHGKRPDRVVPRVLLHKVAAAVVIFFLPYMINMTISLVVEVTGEQFSFTECWNAASKGQGVIQWVSQVKGETTDSSQQTEGQ